MFKNILVFLVSLLITLPSNNQYYFSYSNSDNQHLQTNCAFYAPEENESQVQPIDSERKNVTSLNFFKFISSVKVNLVSWEGDAKLKSYQVDEDGKTVTCSIYAPEDYSKISLSFFNDNDLIDKCSLYFAKDKNGSFYSSAISLDTARRAAGQSLNYNLVDETTSKNSNDEVATPYGIGASGVIYGKLKWTDQQGGVHPLVGAKVKATMSMSWWSAETYTDVNGYYKIDYTDIWHLFGGIPMIHIYTESDNVKVLSDGTYEKTYEFTSGEGGEYSYTFSPDKDSDMGKAMMVFQGVKNFSNHAEELNGGVPIDFCNVKYPDGTSGAYYDGNGTIHLSAETPKYNYSPEAYASWDVLGHEYGHHVQKVFGISANPGGTHYIPGNNIDDQFDAGYALSEAKDRGQKLSWGEGWPTYWSTIAQSHFNDDLKSIYTVGDTKYTSTNGFNYELDYYGSGRGDADEQAIQRFLFKLYDSKTDDYDKFALGETTLWSVVVENKPVTFSEFMQNLYDAGYDKNDLGILLNQYNVIVGRIVGKNYQYFDTLPTFTWSTGSGSSNLRFDQFDFYFTNSSGAVIQKIENISASSNYLSYTPTSAIWQKIYNAVGTTFNAYFVARQTLSYVSGNYYSEITTFNKPTKFSSSKIQIKPNEWGFEGRYYFTNEIENINSIENDTNNIRFSELAKNDLTITTDRLRCGYIEKSYINFSPRREDAGYAYFEMNFDKPIYSVLYSVGFWSNFENLDGTAVLKIKDSNGNWTQMTNLLSLQLNARGQGLKRYSNYFPNGIYGLKFECTATATGSRNMGRLSIDDIVLGMKTGSNENNYYITNYGKTAA